MLSGSGCVVHPNNTEKFERDVFLNSTYLSEKCMQFTKSNLLATETEPHKFLVQLPLKINFSVWNSHQWHIKSRGRILQKNKKTAAQTGSVPAEMF